MQQRYAIKTCNTDTGYGYAIQIYDTDLHIKICNTDMQ